MPINIHSLIKMPDSQDTGKYTPRAAQRNCTEALDEFKIIQRL